MSCIEARKRIHRGKKVFRVLTFKTDENRRFFRFEIDENRRFLGLNTDENRSNRRKKNVRALIGFGEVKATKTGASYVFKPAKTDVS